MDRRVEMRAGVLAEAQIVPVPARPALVVARDFLHAERPALAHFRGGSTIGGKSGESVCVRSTSRTPPEARRPRRSVSRSLVARCAPAFFLTFLVIGLA